MSIWNALWDLLCPPACVACDAYISDRDPVPFCAVCEESLLELPDTRCVCCAEPYDTGPARLCAACAKDPPAFADAWAPWQLGGALLAAVARWKYGPQPDLGRSLSRAFVAAVEPGEAEVVIPVPLHSRRLRRRGFNPAAVLASVLAKTRRLPLLSGALRRVRDTPAQVGLGRRERASNIRGAFAVVPGTVPRLKNRRVILIDDVLTTGATADACAAALRRAGAAQIVVRTLARAP